MKNDRFTEKSRVEFEEYFLRDELRAWEPFTLLIFGASGNLTGRKLIPALFQLFLKERLPGAFDVVGISRTKMTDEEWRGSIEAFIPFETLEKRREPDSLRKQWEIFSERLIYFPGDATQTEVMKRLENFLAFLENGKTRRRIFYLATAPDLYLPILEALRPSAGRLRNVWKEKFGQGALREAPIGEYGAQDWENGEPIGEYGALCRENREPIGEYGALDRENGEPIGEYGALDRENGEPIREYGALCRENGTPIGEFGELENEPSDISTKRRGGREPCRIVVEKPFGRDLKSAQRLNDVLRTIFYEDEIFRMDHYLGKETAQNLLVLRFANSIFEPIWNRNFIREVQITASEEDLVGRRAAYFNRAGILRDMFQNHLLQLLALTAMEPPSQMEAESLRNEKVKVLRAVRPFRSAGEVDRNTLRGQYLQQPFALDEETEFLEPYAPTFAILELNVDNWRWRGVPFFLRAGKGMNCRTTQILLRFHEPPCLLFPGVKDIEANMLLIQLQPAEGIQLYFQTKIPDSDMATTQGTMNFTFDQHFQAPIPDAYENLLLDVFRGDTGLFIRDDEVEAAWRIMDPIQNAWDGALQEIPKPYSVGSWGPSEAERWMERKGSRWFNFCPILSSCKSSRSRNDERDSTGQNKRNPSNVELSCELQNA